MQRCLKCGGFFAEGEKAMELIKKGERVIIRCPHCKYDGIVSGADATTDPYYANGTENGIAYLMFSYKRQDSDNFPIREGRKAGKFKLIHKVETPDKTEAIELWGNGMEKEIRQFYTNLDGVYRFCGTLPTKFDFFDYWIAEWRKGTDFYKKLNEVLK